MLPAASALALGGMLTSVLAADFDPWFESFRRTSEIDTRLDELEALSPMVELIDVGTSIEGRTIRAVVIGHGGADRPTVVAIGTQHAREWISPMVTTCLADAFARGWTDQDPEVVDIIDQLDVVIIPVVNPDGYEYSWDFDRYWRKNRRPGGGVDLNRNWNAMWGTGVGGAPPSSEIYPGTGAFSEPETAAVRDLVASRNVVGFLDYHSPIATILYPFAYTSEPGPEEETEQAWADAMAMAITDVHGVQHGIGKPGVGNPSGGLAQDWAHGEQGSLAWTVELRGGDFVLPEDEIIPACEENYAGFVEVAQRMAREFGEPPPGGADTGTTGGNGSGEGSSGGLDGTAGGPSGESGEGPGGGSGGGPGEGSGEAGATSTSGPVDPLPGLGDEGGGCGCQQRGSRGAPWLLGLLIGLSVRRRPTTSEGRPV